MHFLENFDTGFLSPAVNFWCFVSTIISAVIFFAFYG